MLGVRDKVVLIACNGQLGKALGFVFAQNRAHTYLAGRDKKELESMLELIKEKNYTATPVEADMSDGKGVKKAIGLISERHSQIDVLAFAFGEEAGQSNLETAAREALPLLKRARAASIISICAHGNAEQAAEATERLAKELIQYGIRANCLYYREMGMEFNPDNHILAGRTLGESKTNPLDVANLALFLAMDDSFWINGQSIAVDGGMGLVKE